MISFDAFCSQQKSEKLSTLLHFCHCEAWAQRVLDCSNLNSTESLQAAMIEAWSQASEAELLEAFSAHPRIGDREVLKNKFASQANKEQGQVGQADERLLDELYTLNELYFDKFSFIFIICASGCSAEFMLEQLKSRLNNARGAELNNAAEEQQKIFLLRLHQTIA